MSWVPEEQRDTRWYLWHQKFWCRVSNILSMTPEYLEHFGMPTSGDPLIDQQTANELVDRYLSVNEMVELYKRGVPIYVRYEKDTVKIYEFISAHLTAWKQRIDQEWNVRDAPLDDLLVLDQFATIVYKHARHHFEQTWVDSFLARKLAGTLRLSRDRVLKPLEPEVVRINAMTPEEEQKAAEEKAQQFPEHNSMAEAFRGQSRIAAGGMKWRS